MADSNCLFCKIVAGEIPATIVASTDEALAFRDINPQAPTHILVIPKAHHANFAATAAADAALAGRLVLLANEVARADGLGGDYRIVANTGPGGGQEVFHTHLHVLGGRSLTWPPG